MIYNHLKGKGYQEKGTGPVIYRTNISVPITANVREYQLEEKSRLERNILVGLWVTPAGTEVSETDTQAAGSIFNSAALTIRSDELAVNEKIYLSQIYLANQQGRPYYISLPTSINLSESKLEVFDNSGIASDTVIEFQAEYVKVAK